MTDIAPLIPQQPVPEVAVDLVGGGRFELSKSKPERFTLINFYRGLHCPQCKRQMQDLNRKIEEFSKRGIDVIAISTDSKERAEQSKKDWEIPDVTIGYGLPLREARKWGLFVSTGRGMTSAGVEEPALFSEPGIFMVASDGTLYCSIVQTMPFIRLHFNELMGALDNAIIPRNYPARGQVADLGEALGQQAAE
jgi:hypothetical protein